jgi:hypothetical protein
VTKKQRRRRDVRWKMQVPFSRLNIQVGIISFIHYKLPIQWWSLWSIVFLKPS